MKTLFIFSLFLYVQFLTAPIQAQEVRVNSDLIPESGDIVKEPGIQTMQQGQQSMQQGQQAIQQGEQAPAEGSQTIHQAPQTIEPANNANNGNSLSVAYGPQLSFAQNDIRAVGKKGDDLKALYNYFRDARTNIYYVLSLKPDHPQALKLKGIIQKYEKDFKELANKKYPSDEEVKNLRLRLEQIEADLSGLAQELNIELLRSAVVVQPSADTDKNLFKSVDSSGTVSPSNRGSSQDKRGDRNSKGEK